MIFEIDVSCRMELCRTFDGTSGDAQAFSSFKFIKEKNPRLLSSFYVPNYTAGLTFFIAVAATNLFHQGNWQRVYACLLYTSDAADE